MRSFDWVTSEQFDDKLEAVMGGESAWGLLRIPGVYEACSEHFNNEVLERLADEHGRCFGCGVELDDNGDCPACS